MRIPLRTTLSLSVAILTFFIGTTTYAATRAVVRTKTPSSSSSASIKVTEAPLPRPPVCMGLHVALRFDGKDWKCETVGGLLVAHTALKVSTKGVASCDEANTWGGATCTLFKNSPTKLGEIKCPTQTLRVDTYSVSGHEDGGTSHTFGSEWHAFCYSRPIKIAN